LVSEILAIQPQIANNRKKLHRQLKYFYLNEHLKKNIARLGQSRYILAHALLTPHIAIALNLQPACRAAAARRALILYPLKFKVMRGIRTGSAN
jgi:hypothetical protein